MIRPGNKDVLEAVRIRNLFRINAKSRVRPIIYSGVLFHSTSVPPGSPPMPAKAPSLLPMGAQTLTLWHQRFSHLNYYDLRHLFNISKDIPIPDSQKSVDLGVCPSCIMGKHHKVYRRRTPSTCADSLLALVHSDTC